MKKFEIGRHTLTYGDDGISVMVYRGPILAAEMVQILATEDRSNAPEVVLLVCDVADAGKLDAEARRIGARSPKPSKRYYTAYLGAGFGYRIMVDMWNRAVNFIHGKKYFSEFFDDEASARVWLLAQREAYDKEKKA